MRPIRYITLHHSKTLWGSLKHFDEVAKDKLVSKDLVSGKYTGFHYIINNGFNTYESFKNNKYDSEIDGLIEEGRPDQSEGIHLKGFNHNSIAILIVGNFDKLIPTKKQWNSLINLITNKCQKYNLLTSKVIGHYEGETILNGFFTDHCPGDKFDLVTLRREITKRLKII